MVGNTLCTKTIVYRQEIKFSCSEGTLMIEDDKVHSNITFDAEYLYKNLTMFDHLQEIKIWADPASKRPGIQDFYDKLWEPDNYPHSRLVTQDYLYDVGSNSRFPGACNIVGQKYLTTERFIKSLEKNESYEDYDNGLRTLSKEQKKRKEEDKDVSDWIKIKSIICERLYTIVPIGGEPKGTYGDPDDIKEAEEKTKKLIDEGAKLNNNNYYHGTTLLSHFVLRNYMEPANILIRLGADVNHQDKNGYTILHLTVIELPSSERCKFVLSLNPDINIKDNQGNTALDLAVKHYVAIPTRHGTTNEATEDNIKEQNIIIGLLKGALEDTLRENYGTGIEYSL
jgi:hypothetical protein